jgi:hypothetical protein
MLRPRLPSLVFAALLGSCFLRCGPVENASVVATVRKLGDGVDVVKDVDCPDALAFEVGATATCTVGFADGSRHRVIVAVQTIDDENRSATFRATWEKQLLGATNRAALQQSMRDQTGIPAELICPDGLLVLPADKPLTCRVRVPAGEAPVDIEYADGQFRWQVGPAFIEPALPAAAP